MGSICPQIPKVHKSAERRLKFVLRNQASRGSERAIILPICGVSQFRPVRVRLIGGGAELPIWADIVEKLCAAVDFRERNAHIGQGDWNAMTRNVASMGISSCRNCAWLYKIGRVFYEMRNCDLEVLAAQSDFGGISDVETFQPRNKKHEEPNEYRINHHVEDGRHVRDLSNKRSRHVYRKRNGQSVGNFEWSKGN